MGHLSPLNPIFERYLAGPKSQLAAHDGLANAVHEAQQIAYDVLQQQAASLVYVDAFQFLTLICIATIPFVFLLRNVAIKTGGPPGLSEPLLGGSQICSAKEFSRTFPSAT